MNVFTYLLTYLLAHRLLYRAFHCVLPFYPPTGNGAIPPNLNLVPSRVSFRCRAKEYPKCHYVL